MARTPTMARIAASNILGLAINFVNSPTGSVNTIATIAAQNSLTTVSYSYWFYIRSTTSNSYTHFQKGNIDGTPYFKVFSNTSDVIVVNAGWSGGVSAWTIPAYTKSAWHHLVVVDDGIVAHVPIIYFDGVSQTVTTVTASSGTRSVDQSILLHGNRNDGLRGLDGIIDEFRMYNRNISAGEAATLFAKGSVTSGLVGYWSFDLPIDLSTTIDSSTSGTNGSLSKGQFVVGNVNLNPGDNSNPRKTTSSRTIAGTRTAVS